jgi:intermediate cleaving peptidase 55
MCAARFAVSLSDIHEYSVGCFIDELSKIGISIKKNILESLYYPHSIGHYLGLDLHDCPQVSVRQPLQANTVITIEPGLYIPLGSEHFPLEFHGIGIRIEDDIVVGQHQPENLTADVPLEIHHLEQIIGTKPLSGI